MNGTHASVVKDERGFATLTLVNAKSANIIGTPAIESLLVALSDLAQDQTVRALVLRGTGDAAFIGGADLIEMSNLDPDTAKVFIARLKALCDEIRHHPVPVIARLAGVCLGAGLEIAMACDLRISEDRATFGMPEVKLGIPSVIHAALLSRHIGLSRASWMLLTGHPIDAQTAESWGLIHTLCELDKLDRAVDEAACQLVTLETEVLRQQKRLLRCWESMDLEHAIDASVAEFAKSFETDRPQALMTEFMLTQRARRREQLPMPKRDVNVR